MLCPGPFNPLSLEALFGDIPDNTPAEVPLRKDLGEQLPFPLGAGVPTLQADGISLSVHAPLGKVSDDVPEIC